MATDLSLRGLGFHPLSTHRLDSIQERLVGRAALRAIALVGALAVAEVQVAVRVAREVVKGSAARKKQRLLASGFWLVAAG